MKKICTGCGKKYIAVRHYPKTGERLYIHKQQILTRPFPHNKIIEACFVKDQS